MSRRTSPKTSTGFTERLARSSATHPWRTIGVWAAIIVVAVLSVGSLLGDGLTSETKQHGTQPDSTVGLELIQDRMTGPQKMSEFVIVRSAAHTVEDAAYKAYVDELAGEIAGLGGGIVESVATYYQTNDPTLVSKDGHAMLVQVVLAGDLNTASDNVDELHAVVTAGQRRRLHASADGHRQPEPDGQRARQERHGEGRALRRPARARRARPGLRRRAGRVPAAGAQHHQHRPGAGPRRPHRPGPPHAHLRR